MKLCITGGRVVIKKYFLFCSVEIAQTWLIAMRPMYLRGGPNYLLFYNGFGAIGIARDFKSFVRVARAEVCIIGYIDTGCCLLEKKMKKLSCKRIIARLGKL